MPPESSGLRPALVALAEGWQGRVAAWALERLGFSIHAVHEREAARQRALSGRCGVLVLDAELPDFDTLALLRALRQEGLATPALVTTGQPSRDRIAACVAAGASGFLVQPFDALAAERALAGLRETAGQRRLVSARAPVAGRVEVLDGGGAVALVGRVENLDPAGACVVLPAALEPGSLRRFRIHLRRHVVEEPACVRWRSPGPPPCAHGLHFELAGIARRL